MKKSLYLFCIAMVSATLLMMFIRCTSKKQVVDEKNTTGTVSKTKDSVVSISSDVARQSITDETHEDEGYMPNIPTYITGDKEKAEYLVENYWSKIPFGNDEFIASKPGKDIIEQHLANYLAMIGYMNPSLPLFARSMDNFISAILTTTNSYTIMSEYLDSYLDNANSPYYNEGLYVDVLKRLLKSGKLDDARKSTLDFTVKLLQRNMPGNMASSFPFTTISGTKYTLDKLHTNNAPIVMIFFDPDCSNCHRILEEMRTDKMLSDWIKENKITMLAIYTENETEGWDKVPGLLPTDWMVGNDHGYIKEKALYNLKAMPSIYLLSPDKKVILKDVSLQNLIDFLRRNL